MKPVVVGSGALGRRIARELASADGVEQVVVVERSSAGDLATALEGSPDVVVVATPASDQPAVARRALAAECPVVTTADTSPAVRELLALDAEAAERSLAVVIGAAFSPGLTCLLARRAAASMDEVSEVHVARHGAGGPACARAYHAALGGTGVGWRDGTFVSRSGGSGRELCWFPDPVGALDCYRADLTEPLLWRPAFGDVERITARRAARRRDRFTARLPMLGPPPAEGGVGAVRVEVRGRRKGRTATVVLGSAGRPASVAATVAVATATAVAGGRAPGGASALATWPDPAPVLEAVRLAGVAISAFDGVR